LTSAPILKIENLDEYFVVCIVACKEGLDGFLTQNDHVVFYESIKLKKYEKNYATHDIEVETIVHAIKMWKHCLMGKKFELRLDHCGMNQLLG
jgi:hypothetical protein